MTISSHDPISADADVAATRLSMPLERLEARLVELAGQITGAECEFLLLVGEFDSVEGWRGWGLGCTASWLSWKCGLGQGAARERVRVARKLAEFPALVEPFRTGRLSYSKVKAISRIATDSNLETLIGWALTNPASVVEKLVAGTRKAMRAGDAAAQHAARYLHYEWAEDGSLVGSFRLPPAEGAQLLVALDGAKAVLPDPEPDLEAVDDAATPPCQRCHDAHGELAGELCQSVSAEALERRRPAKNAADALTALCTAGLAAMRSEVDAGVPLFGLPGLDGDERFQLVIHRYAAGTAQIENGPALPAATAQRLSCGCPYAVQTDSPDGNPLHLGRKTRRIRGRLARAVHRRDGGRCQAPGCTRATAEIHHIRHWEHGGPTCLDNLISLCASHHFLVHEGGWTITFLGPGCWLFQRADGSDVPVQGVIPRGLEPLPHDPDIVGDATDITWDGSSHTDGAVDWLCRNARRDLPPAS